LESDGPRGITSFSSQFSILSFQFGISNYQNLIIQKFNHSKIIMGKLVEEFNGYREKMNDRIMETANTNIKRFFALDTTSYAEGALDVKTKEMLGLVASMVLRCDDCIKYHLGKCYDAGVNSDEMNEIFMIANLVGGSIVIPHYRRAVEYWDELSISPKS
jgi:AhpD family alkylhydroperoxidase